MPVHRLSLEQALEWIRDDELLEVTPTTSGCASACCRPTSGPLLAEGVAARLHKVSRV
jgi:hypothetical protein